MSLPWAECWGCLWPHTGPSLLAGAQQEGLAGRGPGPSGEGGEEVPPYWCQEPAAPPGFQARGN